jgi:hypothetical protein
MPPELAEQSQPDLAGPVASEFHGRREEPGDLECDPWLVTEIAFRTAQSEHPYLDATSLASSSSDLIFREEVQHACQRRGRLGRVPGASP